MPIPIAPLDVTNGKNDGFFVDFLFVVFLTSCANNRRYLGRRFFLKRSKTVVRRKKLVVLESISPTFYEQLLHQFPYAEKV